MMNKNINNIQNELETFQIEHIKNVNRMSINIKSKFGITIDEFAEICKSEGLADDKIEFIILGYLSDNSIGEYSDVYRLVDEVSEWNRNHLLSFNMILLNLEYLDVAWVQYTIEKVFNKKLKMSEVMELLINNRVLFGLDMEDTLSVEKSKKILSEYKKILESSNSNE